MTRKTALHMALDALQDENAKEKIREIIFDLPLSNWTEKKIFDSIEQFILEYGRVPKTTDFKKKGLPPHTVIKHHFGIELAEFILKYYPESASKVNSKIYGQKSAEEWLEFFKNEFERVKPNSGLQYDKNRKKETPCWMVIAKYNHIKNWLSLLKLCNLTPIKIKSFNLTVREKSNVKIRTSYVKFIEERKEFERLHPPLDIEALKQGILKYKDGDVICVFSR